MVGGQERQERNIIRVTHRGAVEIIEVEGGIELQIYSGYKDGKARGLSDKVLDTVFGDPEVIECASTTGRLTFTCKQSADCPRTCVIKSCKHDGTDERTEDGGEEGQVFYIPGRIYYCPCI